MLDDIRNHDAMPTPEEAQWMAVDLLRVIFRAAVLAVITLSIGVTASVVIDRVHRAPAVASGTPA